jgi:hypothetical protein
MNLRIKQSALVIAIVVLTLLAACSGSKLVENTGTSVSAGVDPLYKFSGTLALRGYDPVAYFTEGKAVEGSDQFAHEWKGAIWRFTSAANRDTFASGPEKYAPQYGGYCSWAVSHGYTAKGDPEAWKIVDDKLYLNYSQDVKAKWEKDVPGYISKGDENWPKFLSVKPEHKGE